MGATDICPGTHMCSTYDADHTCANHTFQVSGVNNLWVTGDGLLMNQQSFHRGKAHVDPTAPDRVVFIITFAPRPLERGETRMLGLGGSYSMRWDMWGHTLNDFENASATMVQPWTTLRALGLYKPKGSEWGWDFISQHSMRAANNNNGYYTPSDTEATLMSLPKLFMVDVNDMSPREVFQALTMKWKQWAMYANIAVLISYFVRLVKQKPSGQVFKSMCWTTARIS